MTIAPRTIAAGLPVHFARRRDTGDYGQILPLRQRDPGRKPPPAIEHDLPTPLEATHERAPITIEPLPPASQFRSSWTISQLLKYALARQRLKWSGRLDDHTAAVMTRELFQRLGGMWVKVGQLLSLRTDLMSETMCRELASLQHQQVGFPPEVARQVIEDDLGVPLSQVFAHFEPMPFAAASIAQVHRATLLHNNRAVVVKVMRPDIVRGFARDMRVLRLVIGTLSFLGLFRKFYLREGLMALGAILDEETNYQYETVNLRRMRKRLDLHGVYVPRVFHKLCGRRVLVMEEIQGVLMSQYIRMRHEDPDRLARWSAQNGIAERKIAKRLIITVLRQILEDNEFHGDLHPGNIMLLSDSRIALLDFGSVGRLEQQTWLLYRHSMAALAARDYDRAADTMLMMSRSSPTVSTKALRRDLAMALRQWEFESQIASSTYADRSVAAMSDTVAKVMVRHDLPLSWGLMRVGRSFSTLDASLQTLVPEANFMKLAGAYFKDRKRRTSTWKGRMAMVKSVLGEVSVIAGDAQVLLAPALRQQALRLHGVFSRVARVRLAVLTIVSRGLWSIVAITGAAAFIDEHYRSGGLLNHMHLPPSEHQMAQGTLSMLLSAIPDLNPVHWVICLCLAIFLGRLARGARNSMLSTD